MNNAANFFHSLHICVHTKKCTILIGLSSAKQLLFSSKIYHKAGLSGIINYSSIEADLSSKITKDQKIQVLKLDGKKYISCKQCSYSTTKASDLTNAFWREAFQLCTV